ncbi:hypothetical protein PNEG_00722 [Pneumocystis murina B123]|uniref:Seipin n=1 Tax=Pneumocystis murina (strain B123) TaxID=1069680 RepID=M7NVF8_PNEMU|nr:hypothetical protein PNEG_00722 [Pneumocystis murina B123]EMR11126.1 hypothetical protein PNEG_00722 [Pneumocystis murina B123]
MSYDPKLKFIKNYDWIFWVLNVNMFLLKIRNLKMIWKILIILIILISVLSYTFFVSVISYFLFYWHVIPYMEISQPVYLQYDNNKTWASMDFSSEKRFVNGQFYDIFLELLMPLSDINISIGNFMVKIELFSNTKMLVTSSRSAILKFSSLLLRKLKVLIMFPILLLGMAKEEERLIIPLIEEFKYRKGYETMLKSVNITLSYAVQVYSSKLVFAARLQGIRHIIYYYPISSFVIFISLFWAAELLFIISICLIKVKTLQKLFQRLFYDKKFDFSQSHDSFSKKNIHLSEQKDFLENKDSYLDNSSTLSSYPTCSTNKTLSENSLTTFCEPFSLKDNLNEKHEEISKD